MGQEVGDGMALWTHGANGDCILAFRGADSPTDAPTLDFLFLPSLTAPGMMIAPSIQKEWDTYFAVMKEKVGGNNVYAQEGLKKYTDKCPGGIVATGHSVGGGVAQLFAYYASKDGDPYKMKLPYGEGIKAVYGFGSTMVGYQPSG